jgi:hypothetical protein
MPGGVVKVSLLRHPMPKRLRNLAGTTIAPLFPTFADSIFLPPIPMVPECQYAR